MIHSQFSPNNKMVIYFPAGRLTDSLPGFFIRGFIASLIFISICLITYWPISRAVPGLAHGIRCYKCGQYNEGVGSITPCINYTAHMHLKECPSSAKWCIVSKHMFYLLVPHAKMMRYMIMYKIIWKFNSAKWRHYVAWK